MDQVSVMHIIARMNVGGPAVEIAELIYGLSPDAVSQVLVTGVCAEDEQDFIDTQAPDLPVVRIDSLGRRIGFLSELRALHQIRAEIKRYRPQIVHTHTTKAGVLGRVAAASIRPRPRVVHTYHGHLLHGYFNQLGTQILVHVERLLAMVTERFIAVGEIIRDDLLEVHIGDARRFRVIHSGIEEKVPPDKTVSRMRLGIPEGTKVVAFVGRLTRVKRPDRFLDVARRISNERADVIFLAAGGGNLLPSLEAAASEAGIPVRFMGWLRDLTHVYGSSDLILLTSDNEGVPLSLIEAALAGVPAVATKVGSVQEVVIDGVTGFACEPDAQCLAKYAMTLLSDESLARRMGKRAREHVAQTFCRSRFLEEHSKLYKELSADLPDS